MNYVAIDTSGTHLTVVCSFNGKTESYYEESCGVKHSTSLMPVLEETLKKVNGDLKNVDFFAVVVGAGSFTGIRIGVATVKALAFSYNKPVLPITSFDVLAYNKQVGKYLAVIDAKHDGYYVSGYLDGEVVLEPSFINGEKLKELEKSFSLLSSDKIENFNTETVSLLDGLISAVDKKQKFITADIEVLTPLYIRKSQAEEGR